MAFEQSIIDIHFKSNKSENCDPEQIRNTPTPLLNVPENYEFIDYDFFQTSTPLPVLNQDLNPVGSEDINNNFLAAETTLIQPTTNENNFFNLENACNDIFYTETTSYESMGIQVINQNDFSDFQSHIVNQNDTQNEYIVANENSKRSINENCLNGSKPKKQKCMNQTAIAARINRAKKKVQETELKQKCDNLEKQNKLLKEAFQEFRKKCQELTRRNLYLEATLQNIPHINSLLGHMKTLSSPKINAVNLHSYKSETDKKMNFNRTNKPSVDFSNEVNPGICFHVKVPSNEASIQFCHNCSGELLTKTKPKEDS